MSDDDKGAKTARISRIDSPKEQVLQVERRDYPELAPTDRPRSQSMDGFDEIYTDIGLIVLGIALAAARDSA